MTSITFCIYIIRQYQLHVYGKYAHNGAHKIIKSEETLHLEALIITIRIHNVVMLE